MRTVCWLRSDLRLDDNRALCDAAARANELAVLFVLDDRLLAGERTGAPRVRFLLDCLGRLAADLEARGSRLVLRRGDPVEGFAVRRMYQGENAWSVAHNTDQQGLAHFHLRPSSQGQFRVCDLAGPKETAQAKNLVADFQILSAPLQNPFEIKVTDEQVKLLRGN